MLSKLLNSLNEKGISYYFKNAGNTNELNKNAPANQMEEVKNYIMAKNKFISVVSHDIRNKLNPVVNFLNMTLSGVYDIDENGTKSKLNSKQKKKLGKAFSSANEILSLINYFFDVNKGYSDIRLHSDESEFYLPEIISELKNKIITNTQITETKFILNNSVKEKIIAQKDLLKDLLYQVLLNSVIFSDKKEIKINVSEYTNAELINEYGDEYNKVKSIQNNHYLKIEIIDFGPGIAEANQKKIFEEFYRLDNDSNRLGLGLTIVRILIKLLQGYFILNSKENEGTSIVFYIPFIKTK